MPINEVSRRYVTEEPEFYLPKHWRKKADNVKQGSSDEIVTLKIGSIFDEEDSLLETPYEVIEQSLCLYNGLLKQKVCPEQARMILPQNMMTTWIWSGTLGAFCDMLRLRLDSHTQYETRIVSEKVKDIVQQLFPISTEELLNA